MILQVFKNMIIGLLVGLSTSYIVVTLSALFDEGRLMSGSDLLEEVLIAACMGIVIGLAMFIFDINKLSFTVQLIIHFFVVTLCVFCGGLVGSWFEFSDLNSIIEVFVIELIAYVIIWFLVLIIVKKEVNEINMMLKNRNRKGGN